LNAFRLMGKAAAGLTGLIRELTPDGLFKDQTPPTLWVDA